MLSRIGTRVNPALRGLGFPSSQYVVIQLRGKTCAAPRIQAHLRRLGYEICEKWRLKIPVPGENPDDQNRQNVHDFDHGVDGRPGGILVRIADGVARDRRRMRL